MELLQSCTKPSVWLWQWSNLRLCDTLAYIRTTQNLRKMHFKPLLQNNGISTVQLFTCRQLNIPCKLRPYNACWCPSSLQYKVISRLVIDCLSWRGFCTVRVNLLLHCWKLTHSTNIYLFFVITVNIFRLEQNGRHLTDDNSNALFFKENFCILLQMSLKLVLNVPRSK